MLHFLKVTLVPLAPFSFFLFAHMSLSRFELGLLTVDGRHVTSIDASHYPAPCFATLKRILLVKGWHYHKKQWDHFVCVKGMMKVALYDSRDKSPTKGVVNEFVIGERNPILVAIPPFVYHGFKCVGTEEALIVNVPTEMYDYAGPDEFRLPPDTKEIPYDWGLAPGLKHG